MNLQIIRITIRNYLYLGSKQDNTDARLTFTSPNQTSTTYLPGRYKPQHTMPNAIPVGTNSAVTFFIPFQPDAQGNAKITCEATANNMNGTKSITFNTNDKSEIIIDLYSSNGAWQINTSPPLN